MIDTKVEPQSSSWYISDAISLCQTIEDATIKCGLHVALGGSVLIRGKSDKDVDIFVYPHKKGDTYDIAAFYESLIKLGFYGFQLKNHEKYADDKVVVVSQYKCKRVDFFLLL